MRTATIAWRAAAALSIAALAVVLIHYAGEILLPQPIYAADVGAYLINALFSPHAAARDPWAAAVGNSVFLMAIRGAHALSDHYLVLIRAGSLAAYLGGLAALAQACTRGLAARERWTFLLLALAFPYYPFVVSALPEGAYVGVLAAIGVATVGLYASRPLAHAAVAGALAAVLTLIKPHGISVAGALAAAAALDGLITGRFRLAALRIGVLAAVFLAVGNAIQFAAGEPVSNPLTFFVGDFYGRALTQASPRNAGEIVLMSFLPMTATLALFAGAPCAVALTEIAGRWRAEGRALRLSGQDALVLTLVLAAAATLVMVTIFAVKASVAPSETKRLWGRYFEFYAPLLWLAAAPQLVRWPGRANRRQRLACAALMLAGLLGLLAAFQAGVVLFPWDATALMAFFHPDPLRAPLGLRFPYRAAAVAASLLAAGAIAWRAPPWRAALAYFLALGLLAASLDRVWLGPLIQKRQEFDTDIRSAAALTPDEPDRNLALVVDGNDAQLSFLGLGGFTYIQPVEPGAPAPPAVVAYDYVVAVSPALPPAGWPCAYRGKQVTVCSRPRRVASND